jgi:sporulation protein YlmC with PRC-barrel domain
MKAKEFIGMKVLNKEANEVGKIADLAVNLRKCLVDKIIIVEGSALNKKYFSVTEKDIAEIGDYVQLELSEEDIFNLTKVEKIDDIIRDEFNYKEFTQKTVISVDAMKIGKIENMVIDPKECLIHNIIIKTGGAFNKKHLMISDTDIKYIGDYIILKHSYDDLGERIVD